MLFLSSVPICIGNHLLTSNYPRQMNITREFVWVLGINWTLCAYFEIVNRWPAARDACAFGLFNALSLGEVIRSCGIICLLYCLTYKNLTAPKTTFSWIFKDLSKFIFEPTCYITFLKYLAKKEPARSSDSNRMRHSEKNHSPLLGRFSSARRN